MNGTEVLSNENSINTETDDDSFVVLGRSLLPESSQTSSQILSTSSSSKAEINGSSSSFTTLPKMPTLQQPNSMTSSVNSTNSTLAGSSLSPDEIQRKLHDLLLENVQLKETLHQNNLAMKKQFNVLVMWQEDVMKVHASHKEKFEETKQLIANLRNENATLKKAKTLSESTLMSELENENKALKSKLQNVEKEYTSNTAQLVAENKSLVSKIKVLENKIETSVNVAQVETENESLKNQIQVLEKKLERFKDNSVHESSKMEKELDDLVDQLTRQLALVERSRREETVNHQCELEAVQAEITTLKEQLHAAQKKLTEHEVISESLKSASIESVEGKSAVNSVLLQNAQIYDKHIADLNTFFNKQKSRHAILHNTLEVAIMMLTKGVPQFELVALRDRLSDELEQGQHDVDIFISAQNNFQKIFKDYQHVTQELSVVRNDLDAALTDIAIAKNECISMKKDMAAINKERTINEDNLKELKILKERVQSLHTIINAKDDTITQKNTEIGKLHETVNTLRIENESIGILTAQVEVYQSDFNAERSARQNIASEKDRLAEDLRLLQRRNQQLIEEIEKYQKEGFVHIGSSIVDMRKPSQSRSRPPPQESRSSVSFDCPKCEFKFSTYQALENHVYRCLDLDNYP